MRTGDKLSSSGSVGLLAAAVVGVVIAAGLILLASFGFVWAVFWGLFIAAVFWFIHQLLGLHDEDSSYSHVAEPSSEASASRPDSYAPSATPLMSEPAPETSEVIDPVEVATPDAPSDTAVFDAVPADGMSKPVFLETARDGTADDLKKIKGVGPKLEELLHSLGIYHFDQIASWTAPEVAWVDENLEGFKGRVSRDEWVEQARILAAGGTTEFAEKVDEGKVY